MGQTWVQNGQIQTQIGQYFQFNIEGTVFEIGSRRMEIYAVHHARATIQWLKASKDNSVQAEMLLKNIYVN